MPSCSVANVHNRILYRRYFRFIKRVVFNTSRQVRPPISSCHKVLNVLNLVADRHRGSLVVFEEATVNSLPIQDTTGNSNGFTKRITDWGKGGRGLTRSARSECDITSKATPLGSPQAFCLLSCLSGPVGSIKVNHSNSFSLRGL